MYLKVLAYFLQDAHVSHDIPYNSQRQIIIKGVNFVLKNQMDKQKWGKWV